MTGIYKITSPSGNVYIGQSIDIKGRWYEHKKPSSRIKHYPISRSFKKYGHESHSFEVVHELPADVSQEVLNSYECLYMELYENCGIQLLNSKSGGSNGRLSDESRRKLAASVSKSVKGRKFSEEHKKNLSKSLKGNPSLASNRGKKFSAEHRRKISEGQKGRKLSPEHAESIRKRQTGKKQSAETIAKRMAKTTGQKRVFSEQGLANIREGIRRFHEQRKSK